MNDHDLFIVVGALLGLYALAALAHGVSMLYRRIKSRKTRYIDKVLDQFDGGHVPLDYSKTMNKALDQMNSLAENAQTLAEAENARVQFERLKGLRVAVARIRDQGFVAGVEDREAQHLNCERNPYPPGSGAAQQWARGYCMGQGIQDPSPWIKGA